MGVTRRAVVGGMLGGLGDALMQYGQTRVMRRQKAQEIADARAWEMEKARIQALAGLSSKIADDPTQAHMLLQGAAMNPLFEGLNLGQMRPPDASVIAALKSKVAGVKNAEDLPNPEDAAGMAGLDTQPVAPAGPGAGSQFGFMAPSSSFEGTNPSVQPVQQAVIDRKNALRLAADEKIAQAGRQKQEESYGTATGTNQAKNENAPIALQNDVTRERTMRPEVAKTAGAKAGAETAAQFSPDNNRRRAQSAGMVAGSETGSRLDAENSRADATASREQTIAAGRARGAATEVVTPEKQQEISDALTLAENIWKDKAGMSKSVGPYQQYNNIPDADRNRFIARHDQLMGILQLAQAGKLKGQGQITQPERELLANAATALKRGLSEKDYRAELAKVMAYFERKRLQMGAMGQAGVPGSTLNAILGK
jgi:hypothetical protein